MAARARRSEVRVAAPPRHAVSLNQGTNEILLSLGLADRLAGTATWTDPVMKGLEKADARVPRIADNNPSFERVLDADPDFVAASFVSTLGKGGVATREHFEKLGVPTYVSPSDCAGKDNSGDGDGARDKALGIDTVYGEVRDLAAVFGVKERGDELVASLQQRMKKATSGIDPSDVTLLYWFANSAPWSAPASPTGPASPGRPSRAASASGCRLPARSRRNPANSSSTSRPTTSTSTTGSTCSPWSPPCPSPPSSPCTTSTSRRCTATGSSS